MSFPDEMQRLADHFRAAHDDRVEGMAVLRGAVTAIRAEAAHTLTRLHSGHRKMARALGERLSEANAARHTAEQKRQADAARATRGRAEFVSDMRATAASLRASTVSTLKEINNVRRQAHHAWAGYDTSMRHPTTAATVSSPSKSRRGKGR